MNRKNDAVPLEYVHQEILFHLFKPKEENSNQAEYKCVHTHVYSYKEGGFPCTLNLKSRWLSLQKFTVMKRDFFVFVCLVLFTFILSSIIMSPILV